MIIWIFGQPGSGKTTIAKNFLGSMNGMKAALNWMHVDGDDIRELYGNKKYGIAGRIENHQKAIELCRYLQRQDKNVVVSMVTPYRLLRRMIFEELKDVTFVCLVYSDVEIRGKEKFHLPDFEMPVAEYSDREFVYINTSLLPVGDCCKLLLERTK